MPLPRSPVKNRFKNSTGLLKNQLANITNILMQASKNRNSEEQKKNKAPPAPPAKVQVPVTEGDSLDDGGPVKGTVNGTAHVDDHREVGKGSGGIFMQTAFIIPASIGGQVDGTTDHPPDVSTQKDSTVQQAAMEVGDDPLKLLDELESLVRSSGVSAAAPDEDTEDLESLRLKLTSLFSPARETAVPTIKATGYEPPSESDFVFEPRPEAHRPTVPLVKGIIPFVIALQVEKAGCAWEDVAHLCKFLFSGGEDGYTAQQEQDALAKEHNDRHEKMLEHYLKDEAAHQAAETQAKLSCRVVATNVAADAELEDFLGVFTGFKFNIDDITFDKDRHTNGTHTVYVDMATRDEAKRASRVLGSIFGLQVELNLAVEDTD